MTFATDRPGFSSLGRHLYKCFGLENIEHFYTRMEFNGNDVSLRLPTREKLILPGDDPTNPPTKSFQFTGLIKGKHGYDAVVTLDPNFELLFKTKASFHKVLGDVVNANPQAKPETLKTDLEYHFPIGVWNGLPLKFLEYMTGFAFGPANLYDDITWPKDKVFGEDNKSSLKVREDLVEKISDLSIIRTRQETESVRGRTMTKRNINLTVPAYQALRPIEDLYRNLNEERESIGVKMSFEGEVPVEILKRISSHFDQSLVRGRVFGKDFSAIYHNPGSENNSRTNVYAKGLENAARIEYVLPFDKDRIVVAHCLDRAKFGYEIPEENPIAIGS